jgi:hypothetical protein
MCNAMWIGKIPDSLEDLLTEGYKPRIDHDHNGASTSDRFKEREIEYKWLGSPR